MKPNDHESQGRCQAGDQPAMDSFTMARQRTVMANERTFSAWMRTGLALVVAAIALPRIIHFVRWAWTLKLVGIIFLFIAAVVFYIAYSRYDIENKLLIRVGGIATPSWLLKLLTIALLATAIISVALVLHE